MAPVVVEAVSSSTVMVVIILVTIVTIMETAYAAAVASCRLCLGGDKVAADGFPSRLDGPTKMC